MGVGGGRRGKKGGGVWQHGIHRLTYLTFFKSVSELLDKLTCLMLRLREATEVNAHTHCTTLFFTHTRRVINRSYTHIACNFCVSACSDSRGLMLRLNQQVKMQVLQHACSATISTCLAEEFCRAFVVVVEQIRFFSLFLFFLASF